MQRVMEGQHSSSGDPPPTDGGGGELMITSMEGGDLRRSMMREECGSSKGTTAKYKLMPPAKLPISRSPCLTIPPGLSPTSFLDSPLLLSNLKGEPSPTTGSFFKPQMMHNSSDVSSAFSSAMGSSNTVDGGQSNGFEFKPNPGAHSVTGFSFPGSLVSSADWNQQQGSQIMQVQLDCQTPSSDPSLAVKSEIAAREEMKSSLVSSGVPDVDSNELNNKPDSSFDAPTSHSDQKVLASQAVTERTSEDGYNWRKYGQKLVKGSEYPRSYYKCTHPNCEVKKLFERSPDGQITEIIYKGEHDHPRPQPNRRLPNGSMMSTLEEKSDRFSPLSGQDVKPGNSYYHTAQNNEPSSNPDQSPCGGNDIRGEVGVSHLNRTVDDTDDDDPFAKRRRLEIGEMDINTVVKPIREPRVVVQTVSEVDILDDGYRWRKYGQKVVRGNPNPRSYYKCTHPGCPVRKHVERASHDPKAVITTYEGKHNHEVPTAKNSSHDTSAATTTSLASQMGSRENSNQVSLDLGVGIRSASNFAPGQQHGTDPNLVLLQSAQFSNFPGYVSGGMAFYGSRENHSEGHSFGNQPVNHSSNQYQQNIGRILTGP